MTATAPSAHLRTGSSGPGVGAELRRVLSLARPWRKDLRYGIASGVLQQVLFVAGAAVAAYAAARAVRGASYQQIDLYLLGLVVIVLPQVRTPWLESVSLQAVANRVEVGLRKQVFAKIDQLTPAGLAERRSGDVGGVAMADVAVLRRFFAETLPALIAAATIPILALAGLAVLSWRLALVVLPAVAVAGLTAAWLQRRARSDLPSARAEVGRLSADLVDSVQGLREIITLGARDTTVRDLIWRGQRIRQARSRHDTELIAQHLIADASAAAGALTVLAVGAALVAHHQLGATLLPPAATLAALSFGPIERLPASTNGVADASAAGRRIFALLDRAAPVTDSNERATATPRCPGVRFDNVSFRYRPDRPDALKRVTFTIDVGQTVALVGHSGAGKTTCVNLLLRFWDPCRGAIILGGEDIRDIPQAELHHLVGYVSQDVYLFNTTIDENLRLGRPAATDDDVEDAARAANAWEFIRALPGGLQTRVGERGSQLSAGQRQRLAIARALLADSPVLILDEPVSNLDADNERALTQALSRLRTGRTTLLIGHRPSTIQTADRIVVLDHGQVVESGTPSELGAVGTSERGTTDDHRRPTRR